MIPKFSLSLGTSVRNRALQHSNKLSNSSRLLLHSQSGSFTALWRVHDKRCWIYVYAFKWNALGGTSVRILWNIVQTCLKLRTTLIEPHCTFILLWNLSKCEYNSNMHQIQSIPNNMGKWHVTHMPNKYEQFN